MSTPALPASRLGRITRGAGPGLLLAHGAGGGIEPNFGPINGRTGRLLHRRRARLSGHRPHTAREHAAGPG